MKITELAAIGAVAIAGLWAYGKFFSGTTPPVQAAAQDIGKGAGNIIIEAAQGATTGLYEAGFAKGQELAAQTQPWMLGPLYNYFYTTTQAAIDAAQAAQAKKQQETLTQLGAGITTAPGATAAYSQYLAFTEQRIQYQVSRGVEEQKARANITPITFSEFEQRWTPPHTDVITPVPTQTQITGTTTGGLNQLFNPLGTAGIFQTKEPLTTGTKTGIQIIARNAIMSKELQMKYYGRIIYPGAA